VSDADRSFAERYGPWALVLGASDGVGAAYARAMAERGLNVVVLARRRTVLDEVAGAIAADTGVETQTLAVDLAEPDAMAAIAEGTAGLEVGMVMYCAGADPDYQPFLANSVDAALAMVQRNCTVPLQVCHHFAGPMVERGRGGIVLLSSGAGMVGGANMVAYAASKAFDTVMAEALWAELHDQGIDVLGLVLGATDTPALRTLLAERGVLSSPASTTTIPGASTVDEVVADAIAYLADGPTWYVGDMLRDGAQALGGMPRNDAVRLMAEHGGALMATPLDEA
jgi:short-subunit dehydrogenase